MSRVQQTIELGLVATPAAKGKSKRPAKPTSELLTNLTPAQLTAVTHKSGPLLIIAGAGSGKTNVITRRLAWLLSEQKIAGDNILAVTFSNKATEEMEERLDKHMPVGFDEPWINTFHAFGERVLRQEALALGLDPGFTVLTPAQQHVLVRRNLDKFELSFYRPSGNPTKFISALVQHFSRAKDEAVRPEEYVTWAEKNLAEADKTTGMEERVAAKEEAERQLEVAKAYRTYEQLLTSEGQLDVADLITKTLELFRRRPSVLARYQKRFIQILVDEFQDTNTAQYELIKLLAGSAVKGSAKGRALVVVADDDQAIYRWRGASVANVLQFMRDNPKAKQVALIDNFRSRQPILDAAYRVVQQNNPHRLEHELKINKKLTAVRGSGALPVHYQSATLEHEVAHLMSLLNKRHEDGLPWSEMALLVRSNASAEPLIAGMTKAGIPFQFFANKGLFARPEILDLLAWLRVIADYNDSISLYRLMASPLWKVSGFDLVSLLHFSKRYSMPLLNVVRQVAEQPTSSASDQENGPMPSSEYGDAPGAQVSDATRLVAQKIVALYDQHVELATDKSAGSMLINYLEATKLLDRLEKKQTADNLERILNINQFLKLVLEFERDAKDKSARGFLEFYELLLAAGESPSPADVEAHPEAVRILTVHASKGLEFSLVGVFHAVEQHFPSRSRRDPIELPLELVERHEQLAVAPDEKLAHLAEERRLFYVACTRAKDELFITTSLDDGGVRKRKPSRFIEEAGLQTVQTPEQSAVEMSQGSAKAKPATAPTKSRVKLPLPKRFSYTQLTVFDTCPLQYKFAHIYKIPSLGSHVFSYGKSLHETLAQFMRELKAEPKTKPSLDRLLELLEHYWMEEWYQSKAHEQRRKVEAKQALTKWFEVEGKLSAKNVHWIEQDFSLKVGEYQLHGRIDRADLLPDGSLEIIDYKTGKLKDPKEQQKNQQLALYALAAKKTYKQKVSKLSWYFLDAGQKISTSRTDQELTDLETEIHDQIKAIISSEFIPTPGFHCKFCDFKNICEVGQASGNV